MEFDATVTLGNVLTIVGGLFTILTVAIAVIGGRYFPSKGELTALRTHVDAQISDARTDVETAVRSMENFIDKEVRSMNELARERYERQSADWQRLESTITNALTDVREARDMSRAAEARSVNTKDTLDQGIKRLERAVETLLNRQRLSDTNK